MATLTLIIIVLALAVIFVAVVSVVILGRRGGSASNDPAVSAGPELDAEERSRRRQTAVERGNELLDRRVELDSRRGTLGGNSSLDEALQALETRRERGEISGEEFESQKTRLLGG